MRGSTYKSVFKISALLLFTLIISPVQSIADQGTFTIMGRVVDATTKLPIRRARIEFNGPRTTEAFGRMYDHAEVFADSFGRFSFTRSADSGLDGALKVVAANPGVHRPSPATTVAIVDGGIKVLNFSLNRETWMIKELSTPLFDPPILFKSISNSGLCVNPMKGMVGYVLQDCNDVGWVVGNIFDSSLRVRVPIVFKDGALVQLPQLNGVFVSSPIAEAANEAGVIVGTGGMLRNGRPTYGPIRWTNGVAEMLSFPPLSVEGQALDVNELNEAAGTVSIDIPTPVIRGVFWKRDGSNILVDYGPNKPANIVNSFANVMADSSEVGGYFTTPNPVEPALRDTRLFRWTELGGMVDMGNMPGHTYTVPLEMNNRGDTVGSSLAEARAVRLAFIENPREGFTDLNHLIDPDYGFKLEEAHSLNDKREIVGIAWKNNVSGTPTKIPFYMKRLCPSDLNGDDVVDFKDFSKFKSNYGRSTGTILVEQGDLDGDNKVTIFDYFLWVANFGKRYGQDCRVTFRSQVAQQKQVQQSQQQQLNQQQQKQSK